MKSIYEVRALSYTEGKMDEAMKKAQQHEARKKSCLQFKRNFVRYL